MKGEGRPNKAPVDLFLPGLSLFNISKQHEKKEIPTASLTLDALCDEIDRLRSMNRSCGTLSRSNKRQLAKYKSILSERLGATVIYSEDRLVIPKGSHADVLKELKRIDRFLKKHSGAERDGCFFHLMCNCFDFGVSLGTVQRNYYISEEEQELL